MMRPVLSVCCALLLMSVQGRAQVLRPVPAGRVETLINSLPLNSLPIGASHPEVDRKQIVGTDTLSIVPVRFQAPQSSGEKSILPGASTRTKAVCGVFVQKGDSAKFLTTLGTESTETETCNRLISVGALRPGTPHGDLVLIYDASSPNASAKEPIVLSWSESDHMYNVNEERSQKASTGVKGPMTVAAVRRVLAVRNGATKNP